MSARSPLTQTASAIFTSVWNHLWATAEFKSKYYQLKYTTWIKNLFSVPYVKL